MLERLPGDLEEQPLLRIHLRRFTGSGWGAAYVTENGVGYKWAGEKGTKVLSVWEHGWQAMIEETHRLISEADAVASYNGASFDMPKLMGNFLLAGLPPPPPPTQIDIYKSVRKLGFICNKLDYIAPLLGLVTVGRAGPRQPGFRGLSAAYQVAAADHNDIVHAPPACPWADPGADARAASSSRSSPPSSRAATWSTSASRWWPWARQAPARGRPPG